MNTRRHFAALFATAIATAAVARNAPTSAPAANKWVAYYHDRVARFRQENAAAKNIVLVGDSLTEGFDAARWLPGRRVVNRGITSDGVGLNDRGVLHRLDESVFDCNPGVVVLEIGVNDVGDLWRGGRPSMDDIDACYRTVVRRIRDRLPGVPLILISGCPSRDRYAGLAPLVRDFNSRLEKVAADFGLPMIDLYTPLADADGTLKKEYSRDGLHLTEAGYRIWAERLEKVLPPAGPATRPAKP